MDVTMKSQDEAPPSQQTCVHHTFHFVSETPVLGLKPDQRQAIRSHVMKRYKLNQRRDQISEIDKLRETRERQQSTFAPASTTASDLEHGIPESSWDRQLVSTHKKSQRRGLADRSKQFQIAPKPSVPQGSTSSSTSHTSSIKQSPGQRAGGTYCIVCGSPESAWLKNRSHTTQQEDQDIAAPPWLPLVSSRSSPLGPFGAGRVDPFASYPGGSSSNPYFRELMDHAMTYLLPGLLPEPTSDGGMSVSKFWFKSGLKYPLLFHALIFAGSIHLDFLRYGKIYPNKPAALAHKLIVLKDLKQVMGNIELASQDEIILAILVLSSHETMQISERKRRPFNSPLQTAQWLNVYSRITYVTEHMVAVMKLVEHRGGLENLKMSGLAETITSGDLIAATNSLGRPTLPLLRRYDGWLDHVVNWAKAPPRLPIQKLGRGFVLLQNYGLPLETIKVFNVMGSMTMAIDHYVQGKPAGLSLGALSKIRVALQHQILSLPEATEISDSALFQAEIYESCRTTALIYSISVVFPVSNSYNLLQLLVRRLKQSLLSSSMADCVTEIAHVHLWALVLGGIAALDKPERTWFVAQLKIHTRRWNIYDWESVEDILGSFLWLESACDLGGKLLWLEVMDKQSYLEAYH